MRAFYKNLKKVQHPFFSCFEASTDILRKKLKVKTVIHKNKVHAWSTIYMERTLQNRAIPEEG